MAAIYSRMVYHVNGNSFTYFNDDTPVWRKQLMPRHKWYTNTIFVLLNGIYKSLIKGKMYDDSYQLVSWHVRLWLGCSKVKLIARATKAICSRVKKSLHQMLAGQKWLCVNSLVKAPLKPIKSLVMKNSQGATIPRFVKLIASLLTYKCR